MRGLFYRRRRSRSLFSFPSRPRFQSQEAERASRRVRYIYGLFFSDGNAYIGQTVSLSRRHREHRKSWPSRFRIVRLDRLRGTYADAEIAEQAWRCLAVEQGRTILAFQGDASVQVNPNLRRTEKVQAYISRKKWPKRLVPWFPWFRLFSTLIGALLIWGVLHLTLSHVQAIMAHGLPP